jgi:hypothetical protein
MSSVQLSIDPSVLTPLVEQIVTEVLSRVGNAQGALPERLAFGEAEAARLLGLNQHQLRDERLRGRIAASKIVGGRVSYLRQDLLAYLSRNRTPAA